MKHIVVVVVYETGPLYNPGYPGDHAGLELRDPGASASQMLALKGCATTA